MISLSKYNVTITSGHKQFQVLHDKYIMMGDAILVFQLDSDFKELMQGELNGKINSVTICHIPVESGIQQYYKDLSDLLDYIIHYQQNDIVFDHFYVVNKQKEFYDVALKAMKEQQKKITKNDFALFPKEKISCYNVDYTNLNFTFGDTEYQSKSYFCRNAAVTQYREEIWLTKEFNPLEDPTYSSDGTFYEIIPSEEQLAEKPKDETTIMSEEEVPDDLVQAQVEKRPPKKSSTGESSGSSSSGDEKPEPEIWYRRVWQHEKTTIPFICQESCLIGTGVMGIESGNFDVTIERKLRPDEYLKINP